MAEKDQQKEQAKTEAVAEEKSLLDQIIDQGRMARDESQRSRAKDLISEFVSQVMEGAMTVSKDTEAMINARIAQIDKLLSDQLNEVMHHDDFQKLEASWRGLFYLVSQSETGEKLKIRVMNTTKNELLKDMEKATEFDQSTLFKKIYEEEFGMFGGASYGALIGDYEFGNHPQDLSLLGEDLPGGCRFPCAVHFSGISQDVQPGHLYRTGSAQRPGQDLPERGLCQVEVFP